MMRRKRSVCLAEGAGEEREEDLHNVIYHDRMDDSLELKAFDTHAECHIQGLSLLCS